MSKIFDGDMPLLQRFDTYPYPEAQNLTELQLKSFWIPEEISLQRDRIMYDSLPESHKESFKKNLLFQTLADSTQSRGIDSVLAERCSEPSFEAVFRAWSFFETLHSLSYSYIVRSMYPNPKQFFDDIEKYPFIINRLKSENDAYKEENTNIPELLIRILSLEGVKFYSSFLITYAISDMNNDALKGTCDILNLIQHDESIHTGITSSLIRIEGVNTEKYEDLAFRIFDEVVKSEIEYVQTIRPDDLYVLNTEDVSTFIKYRADKCLVNSGFPKLYNVEPNSLTTWFNDFSNINKQKAALQETTGLSYTVGDVKNDW